MSPIFHVKKKEKPSVYVDVTKLATKEDIQTIKRQLELRLLEIELAKYSPMQRERILRHHPEWVRALSRFRKGRQ